jgi:hypothetical protein
MDAIRKLLGEGPIAEYAGPRAFFKTATGPGVYPNQTAYPESNIVPNVYYARKLKNVTFPRTVGIQALTYDETDQYDFIFNLEPEKYIEEHSVVLCFRENGRWFTIDKVLEDDLYPCFREMRRKSPLRMTVKHKVGFGGEYVVLQEFELTMRWHNPTPDWLQDVRPLHPTNIREGCPQTGVNLFGTGGLWLSDEEMVFNSTPSGTFPINFNPYYAETRPFFTFEEFPFLERMFGPQPPVRAFIAPLPGWAERRPECTENISTEGYELNHSVRSNVAGTLGVGMVRTDHHFERDWIRVISGAPPQYDEPVFHSYASKMSPWAEFACGETSDDPVYGFAFWPRVYVTRPDGAIVGLGTQNGVVGNIDPTTGEFVETQLAHLTYQLTEMP